MNYHFLMVGLTVTLATMSAIQTVSADHSSFKTGLLRQNVSETNAINSGHSAGRLKQGQLIKIRDTVRNTNGKSYWQLTNGKFLPADDSILQPVKNDYQHYYLKLNRAKIFVTKRTIRATSTIKGTGARSVIKAKHFIHVKKIAFTPTGTPKLITTGGRYVTANRSFVKASSGYQNPSGLFQVQNYSIRPAGKIGYQLKRGFEGVKTWQVKRRLGVGNRGNFEFATYDANTFMAVKRFQRSHHLKVTGNVDLKTWHKLGFKRRSWQNIDRYVAPLKAHRWNGRAVHVKAEINQAKKYLGRPYIVGASSSPHYGTDCSGLVMQALYAGGLNLNPISSIHHAYPGNEWNSRDLWATSRLKRINFSKRQAGDLIFYYAPGTRTIYHVAIYLGHNSIIESWPNHTQIAGIRSNSHTSIAGVKRAFN